MLNYIKRKFLNKSFITFCIIGVLNTIINSIIMWVSTRIFDLAVPYDISDKSGGIMYYISVGVSTLLAFITASIFSYFANAKFTYNQAKNDNQTFFEAFLVFIIRYIATYLFTLLINLLIMLIFNKDSDPNGTIRTLSNLIASLIMVPPFYLVFGIVFKRSKERKNNEKTTE